MEEKVEGDRARLVLDIVLKRVPGITSSIHDILTLQLTCSGWRTATLAAATNSSTISIASERLEDATKIKAAGSWIEQHAELISSLQLERRALWPKSCSCVNGPQGAAGGEPACDSICASSDSDSSLSSMCCSCGPAAAEAALTAAIQGAVSAGMKLQCFSTNYCHSADLLNSLPLTIQQLHLRNFLGPPAAAKLSPTSSLSSYAALSRFTALHSLSITTKAHSSDVGVGAEPAFALSQHAAGPTAGLLATLSSLPSLRALSLGGALLTPAAVQQLPQSVTSLVLEECRILPSGPGALDLAHMTNLARLDAVGAAVPDMATWGHAAASAAATASLPPSLTSLTLLSARQPGHTTLNLAPLQQLQHIALLDSCERPTWLLQLGSLPAMKHIHLRYLSRKSVLCGAPTWAALTSLRTLDLQHICLSQHWQGQELLTCLAAATTLTALRIGKVRSPRASLPICAALSGMHGTLASLALDWVDLGKSDPLALTRLTGLTSLSLVRCGPAVDDVAAVAVCLHLRRLRSLVIEGFEGLASMGLLYPVSEVLTSLEALRISGRASCVASEAHVGMLTSLRQLTRLSLPGNADCLAPAVRGLQATVPGLRGGVTITACWG